MHDSKRNHLAGLSRKNAVAAAAVAAAAAAAAAFCTCNYKAIKHITQGGCMKLRFIIDEMMGREPFC